ncbi:Hypothetical protein POVR1_LOCUS445 [uncultured virus]|nr:Hypothetical protein POVR1_LOCUS445 [uncultured virus]
MDPDYIFIVIVSTSCPLCRDIEARGIIEDAKRLASQKNLAFRRILVQPVQSPGKFLDFIITYPSLIVMSMKVYELGINGQINERYGMRHSSVYNAIFNETEGKLVQTFEYPNITIEMIEEFILSSIAKLKTPQSDHKVASPSVIANSQETKTIKAYPRYPWK